MLNNNGRTAMAYMMYSTSTGATAVSKMINSTGIAGTTSQTFSTTMGNISEAKNLEDLETSGNGVSLFVSDNSTIPLDTEYTISSIDTLTPVYGLDKLTKGGIDNSVLFSFVRAFKNETENPITVNSVCLMVHNNTKENFLIYREVLENPVIIIPQEIKMFSIMLR